MSHRVWIIACVMSETRPPREEAVGATLNLRSLPESSSPDSSPGDKPASPSAFLNLGVRCRIDEGGIWLAVKNSRFQGVITYEYHRRDTLTGELLVGFHQRYVRRHMA